MRRTLAHLFTLAALVGCTGKGDDASKVPLGQAAAAAGAASDAALTGAVVEQLAAAPYVYLRIKTTSKGDVWAAVPEAKVANGDVVTLYNPMLMTKFESKSLNRTFDEVYFGSLNAPAGPNDVGGTAPAGAPPSPHAGTSIPVPAANVGKVERAAGADGRTIAEVWAQAATLAGKTVSIRGTVVKFNIGVMGKNWIHLQDGSGDAAAQTHDITVTTLEAAARGSTITITGTLRLNKDFGAGYHYPVIVEDARIVKQ